MNDLLLCLLLACFVVALAVLLWPLRPRRKTWKHYGLALLASVALTGCSGPLFITRAVPVPVVTEVPFEHVTTRTVTDQATGAIERSQVTNVVSMAVTNWTTNVVVEVSQQATRWLTGAAQLNQAVGDAVPNPVSGVLNVGLGGIAALLGWLARVKTKAAREAQHEAEDHRQGAVRVNDLLQTVIVGVEEANVPAVKESIAKISRLWGNSQELHAAVKQQTAK